uniref:COMM domain-containing protein 2 n=1 Tax=Myxine glutinosa TaxID=7769 RepID=UPI00358FDB93
MLLSFTDEHKAHLALLPEMEPEVLEEFCRLAADFLHKGEKPKVYESAAKKLRVDVEEVERAVHALMYLFGESAKLKLNENEMQESLHSLNLPPTFTDHLVSLAMSQQTSLCSTLAYLAPALPRYADLEWRLDVQLASRALVKQMQPNVLLRLKMQNAGGETHGALIQADVASLRHAIFSLEEALAESRARHVRRIARHIK